MQRVTWGLKYADQVDQVEAAATHLSGWWNQLSAGSESCDQTCVSAGAALQADVPEGGALLLVEERQADRGHHHRGAHHRPHHHPAGHRCDPRQRPVASRRQPHPQSAINTLTHAHSVHTSKLSDEVSLRFYLFLEFSGRKPSF